jgi:hypothetical protein
MRIAWLSDVHIETKVHRTRLSTPAEEPFLLGLGPPLSHLAGKVDVLVLAGDIGSASGIGSAVAYAAMAARFVGCETVLVPGNHEYYREKDFHAARSRLLSKTVTDERLSADVAPWLNRVHVLDRQECVLGPEGDRVRFLGATLWTDYALNRNPDISARVAMANLNDHRLIGISKDPPPASKMDNPYRKFLPSDAKVEHDLSVQWLKERFADGSSLPTVVVTHHVPLAALENPRYAGGDLSPCFVSDLPGLVLAAADAGSLLWVFGHHHWNNDPFEVCDMRLVTSQVGYEHETALIGFPGPGLAEIKGGRLEMPSP